MKDILRISVASAILALSVGAGAVTSGNSVEDLPILQQEPQHSSAAKRISTLFTREHYKLIKLDIFQMSITSSKLSFGTQFKAHIVANREARHLRFKTLEKELHSRHPFRIRPGQCPYRGWRH